MSRFLFSARHSETFDINLMYSGFFALKETKTFWIYFFELVDVISGGSFEIFHMVISYMQLIEKVITFNYPY